MRGTRITLTYPSLLYTYVLTPCVGYYTYKDVILCVCLEHGMPTEYKPHRGASTVLEKAVLQKRAPRVELLIRYHADVDLYDGFPIRYAVYDNNTCIISVLIKAGVDVNLHDTYGPAISTALQSSSVSVVSQLLEAGADLPYDAMSIARVSHIDSAEKVEFLSARQKT